MSPIISIIITFHQEGIIAHKTLCNLFELAKPLQEQGIAYEVILHADNADSDTLNYLSRYSDSHNFRIFQNNFGNPSDSRNFCVQQARGRYVAILDGDDIISDNWLIDGYRILEKSSRPLILHVNANVSFGKEESPRVWYMSDSRSLEEDMLNLFTRNRWDAGVMSSREVLTKFPYKEAKRGFGYEDWVFNMDTRYAGIIHKVVPSSVRFYRVHANSVYNTHSTDKVVTSYSEMFSTPNIKKLTQYIDSKKTTIKCPNTTPRRIARLSGPIAKISRKAVTAIPHVGSFAQRGFNYQNRKHGQKTFKGLPEYIQRAWIAANQLDGEAWPDPLKLSHLWTYDSDFNDQTVLYCRLISQIRKDPDYLFLPPRLSVGGTEKVLVNYINAFAELHPDWHIVVLAALPSGHPYHIPDNVDFVDFYSLTQGKSWFEIDFMLSRFITQTKVKRLHIVHNEQAFLWARDHLSLLRDNGYKVYISQFMYEFNKNPQLKVGFLDPWIRDIYPAVTKILTDNSVIAREMIDICGFSEDKVTVHYQPILTPSQHHDRRPLSQKRPLRILWASRVSPQKRPDLLKKIAKHLDSTKYTIDIYGRCQKPYNENYFKSVADVATYKGTYNGIESLDLSRYDAFLYTSQTDGLPNILLEIAASGLPIVASNVGGVSDIVNQETGFLVDMEDVKNYVKTLELIYNDYPAALKKAAKAKKLVDMRHTWKYFLDQVRKDIV